MSSEDKQSNDWAKRYPQQPGAADLQEPKPAAVGPAAQAEGERGLEEGDARGSLKAQLNDAKLATSKPCTQVEAELEAAFRKLPIRRPPAGTLSYESTMPALIADLALMKDRVRKPSSKERARKNLLALAKHARALSSDKSAMVSLPMQLRLLVASLAHADIPDLRSERGRGAPPKARANKIARITAQHYLFLTGERPTRITPVHGGEARSPFMDLLKEVYRILNIDASAESQAKVGISFVNKNFPEK